MAAGASAPEASTTRAAVLSPSAIRLADVTAGYGTRIALADVDLDIQPGSLVAVVGPNGAGKSTLLKVMAGLLAPFDGTVTVLGGPPRAHAHDIAYVPQAEAVDWDFPVTVSEVATMGRYARLGIGRRVSAADRERVDAALETVGMADLRDRQVGALSGGQRRRVFLAKAIAADPELYLLDEPVTGVDATTQEDLMNVLEAETQVGKTVVASTHDLILAAQRFHQAAFINRRVVATGPAEMVLDRQLLSDTYGGHVLILPGDGDRLVLDDAHHHDQEEGGEHHFHEHS
jgi:ABC-type Mn2+/Zn2+ transport system ATPase subunit